MGKYWLYIEAYAMIFRKDHTVLLYNTISGAHFRMVPDFMLSGIIEKLRDTDNGFCVELSESDMQNESVAAFIRQLREHLCGNTVSQSLTTEKPYSLIPSHSVMKSRERLTTKSGLNIGEKVMHYLHSLTIRITGVCNLHCSTCTETVRQILSCTASKEELSVEHIRSILTMVSGSELGAINVVGGNIFMYSDWEGLVSILGAFPYSYNIYADYRHLLGRESEIESLKPLNARLCVMVQGNFDEVQLKDVWQSILSDVPCEVSFQVASEEQHQAACSFCERWNLQNYTLQPVYSEEHPDFFKDNIFMDEDSIFSAPIPKKTIYANMSLNVLDFGKLTINSNGDVYANVNFPRLGNIHSDSIHNILYRELKQGNSWFRVRNQAPCSECIFQWLCPSPSSYEIVMDRHNLCNLPETIH